jgi:hypothetical protein
MKRISNAVIILLCICTAPLTFADESDATNASSVELWVCNYQEGKSIDDLRDWYKDFNTLSDQMDNGNFRSWLWSPFFVSDLTRADVVVATAFPNLESMGQSMMEFFGGAETGALFARYETIVDCHGRELWTVEQTRK